MGGRKKRRRCFGPVLMKWIMNADRYRIWSCSVWSRRSGGWVGVQAHGCQGAALWTLAPCDAKERQQTTPRKTPSPWVALLSFNIDNIRPTPTTDDRRQPRQPAQVSIAIAGRDTHDELDRRRHDDHDRLPFSPHLDSATHLGMPSRPPVARQPMHIVGGVC
jgi:hypothetical protein